MSSDLTPSEVRFVRVLCAAGPMGIAPLGLARVLGVTTATVSNLSMLVERKGFCMRERMGMRVFFHPTQLALEWVALRSEDSESGSSPIPTIRRTRAPRVLHRR